MSEEEKTELFQKALKNTLEVLANNPKEAFNYLKLQEKYNNVLKEKAKLKIENKQLKEEKRKVREYIKTTDKWLCRVNDNLCIEAIGKDKLLEILGADE